jgi:prophage regulatory protein
MTDTVRLLRVRQVCDRTGLSRSTVYELVAKGVFPRPVRISARTVGWLEVEIEDFIRSRIANSRQAERGAAACA